MDVLNVYETTQRLLKQIRSGSGPYLLELETYRFRGHSMADPGTYRPAVEVHSFASQDPVSIAIREVESQYPTAEQIATAGPDCIELLSEQAQQKGHLAEHDLELIKKRWKRKLKRQLPLLCKALSHPWTIARLIYSLINAAKP